MGLSLPHLKINPWRRTPPSQSFPPRSLKFAGVDSRHADQQVRGAVVLPNGTGKTVRTLVFAKDDKIQAALDAGSDYAGGMDYVEKIQKEGWLDFDVVIASPDMMGVIGRLGKILGPKGLMPSPKNGTVTPNVAQAVKEAKAGKIEYRLDKTNIIHCPIGKVSRLSNARTISSSGTAIRPSG